MIEALTFTEPPASSSPSSVSIVSDALEITMLPSPVTVKLEALPAPSSSIEILSFKVTTPAVPAFAEVSSTTFCKNSLPPVLLISSSIIVPPSSVAVALAVAVRIVKSLPAASDEMIDALTFTAPPASSSLSSVSMTIDVFEITMLPSPVTVKLDALPAPSSSSEIFS